MPSSDIPQGVLHKFSSNQRLVVGTAITFVHASIVVILFLDNVPKWRFLVYTGTPSLIIAIIPFLITRSVIERIYEDESLISYLETLSDTTGDSTSVAAEIELTPEVRQQLPEEVADPDSVKVIDGELLDHVDGEEFDSVDADTRGVVAIAFSSLLIVVSAPIVGVLIDGMISTLIGFLCGMVALWIVLQQHRDMIGLIEYTPKSINP
ncbi:hypothetical protein [Natronobacterium texcoconense]|uniref:Uncharacterized protein n=1 Tax=Natronobacterium texcoconense TaxID=1095778 RepID=A0A1H1IY34_NATTX|nr:hypothetical protein [Natronobacterium texcoconense]SDR42569.1 hypothetical protein SAMN04489842_3907 [Natronobacterium texcoconense]